MTQTYYSSFYPNVELSGAEGTTKAIITSAELEDLQDSLSELADDNIITINEKIVNLIPTAAAFESQWNSLSTLASTIDDADVTSTRLAAEIARAGWTVFLNSLIPVWDDVSSNTPVDREEFNSKLEDYVATLNELLAALNAYAQRTANWSEVEDDDGNRPEDGATVGAPDGTHIGGYLDPITGEYVGGRPVTQVLDDSDQTIIEQIISISNAELNRIRDNQNTVTPDGADIKTVQQRQLLQNAAFVQEITSLVASLSGVNANVQQLMEAFTDGEEGFARFLLRAMVLEEGEPPVITGIEGLATTGGHSLLRFMADLIEFVDPLTGEAMLEFDSATGKLKTTKIVVDEIEAKAIKGVELDTGALGACSIFQNSASVNVSGSSWVNLASVSLTPLYGKPVEFNFSCFGRCTNDNSTDYWTRLVRDDGTVIRGGAAGTRARVDNDGNEIAWSWVDGTVRGRPTTWTVQAKRDGSSENAEFRDRFFKVKEDSRIVFQNFTVDSGTEGPTSGTAGGGGSSYNPNQEFERYTES